MSVPQNVFNTVLTIPLATSIYYISSSDCCIQLIPAHLGVLKMLVTAQLFPTQEYTIVPALGAFPVMMYCEIISVASPPVIKKLPWPLPFLVRSTLPGICL